MEVLSPFKIIKPVNRWENSTPYFSTWQSLQPFTGVEISLNNLTIEGTDDNSGYTLTVLEGESYTVYPDNMIQPAADFNGELTVNLTVNDGTTDSEVFGYDITFSLIADVNIKYFIALCHMC